MTLKGHFNGSVVVLDEPGKLALNQRVKVIVEEDSVSPKFGTLAYMRENFKNPMPREDAEEMMRIIEEGCERIEEERDVRFE